MAMRDTSTQDDSRSLHSDEGQKSVITLSSGGPPPVLENEAATPVLNDEDNTAGDDPAEASSHTPPRVESLAERVSRNGSARGDQNGESAPDPNGRENAGVDTGTRASSHSPTRARSSGGQVSRDSSARSSQQPSSSEGSSYESVVSSDNRKNNKWLIKLLIAPSRHFPKQIAYHHVPMIFLLIAIVLSSILVAGCSSKGLRNVYLLSLSYHGSSETQSRPPSQLNPSFFDGVANTSSSASLEVRVGYFGLCARPGEDWTCATDSNSLTENLNATHDPLNLIWVADRFQDQVFLSVLIIISAVLTLVEFGLLSTFPGWHEETDENGSIRQVKPFPAKSITHLCIVISSLISLLLMIAILWQHVAAVAQSSTVQAIFDGSVQTKVGTAAMVLGWVAVGLNVLNTVLLWVMIAGINMLTVLTD